MLCDNGSLRELYLGCNGIEEAGALALAHSWRANTALEKVDVQGARVGAAAVHAVADALRRNASLRQLVLDVEPALAPHEAAEARERAASQREAEVRTAKAGLSTREAALTERELNAERGFEAERARILEPVTDEVERLRKERVELVHELAERRSQEEEQARARAEERAQRWLREDAERSASQAEARRQADEGLARERELQQQLFCGEDAAEGLDAYLNKRKAEFKAR